LPSTEALGSTLSNTKNKSYIHIHTFISSNFNGTRNTSGPKKLPFISIPFNIIIFKLMLGNPKEKLNKKKQVK
jgi:hypothetical protein